MGTKKEWTNLPDTVIGLRDDVIDMEKTMEEKVDSIWTDPGVAAYYKKILALGLSQRRLWLVYSFLDCSLIKTARYFGVDRGTVSAHITEIKNELGL